MKDPVGEQTLEVMSQATYYNDWLYLAIKPFVVDNIVDIGAGKGMFAAKLKSDFSTVAVADYNKAYLQDIKETLPGVSTYFLDLESKKPQLTFKKKFNCAVVINVLEHLSDIQYGLGNISKLLLSGGVVIILVPAFQFAYNSIDKGLGHYCRYNISALNAELSRAGFKPVFSRYLNFWGLWGWIISGKLMASKKIPAWQVKIFDLFSRPWLAMEKLIPFPMGLSVLSVATKV